MSVEILGRREDQRLEFKSKDALADPGTIARAVVGMLNAGGGEVWIGVDEKDGVAASVAAIPDPERAGDRLRDYLVETLDPSPTAQEVTIELAPPAADPALLVVKVQPAGEDSGRVPYAFRKRGGWHFVRRVGARNHPMSRQEIFGQPVRRGGDPALGQTFEALEQARREYRDSGAGGLWLALQPARRLELDLQAENFVEIALDPAVTGNRRAGFHFARSSRQPKLSKDRIEWGLWSEISGRRLSAVEVTERGALHFQVALEHLHHKGADDEIWPLALLEHPISAFRIARVIYADQLDPDDPVAADLALVGVGEWGLRAGTPGPAFSARARHPVLRSGELAWPEEPDLIWEPVAFSFREIDKTPDRCGFRLVRRVYQAFGLRETDMPCQYDPRAGRLILPE
jgi:Schlafen, AlbA_2